MGGMYSIGSGRFTSGQPDAWYRPRIFGKAKPLVVYGCGAGDTPSSGLKSALPTLAALVAAGYSVAQPSTTPLFGNATAMSRITDAITWGRANLPCTTEDVVLVGISNGGVCAMQYLRQNPTDVACAVTVIAPTDLEYVRAGNLLSLRASIDAAWAVTYPAPLPTHGDPLTDQAAYVSVGPRIQQWVSTTDVLDNPASGHSQHEFATAIGADYRSAGAVGHTDTSWTGVDPATVLAFVNAHT